MKLKYIQIVALAFLLTGISACRDSFLESAPTNMITTESYYQNDDDFVTAINGVYNALHEYRQNQDYFPTIEIATPCATQGSTNARWASYSWGGNGYTPSNCQLSANWWKFWWRGVRRSSDIINQVDKKGDNISNQALRDRIQGEAYFLRAYNYFYLTYLYGDVPYITTAADSIYPRRAPHADIVELMISDLKKAEELLPSVKTYRGTANMGRASKGSAMSLLGKVFCYEKRWSEAETELKKVVASGDYKLNNSFVDQFTTLAGENSDESIFEIQYIDQQGDDRASAYATFCNIIGSNTANNDGWNYNEPTEYLTDMYETKDGKDVKSIWTSSGDGRDYYRYESAAFAGGSTTDDAVAFANRDPRLMWTVMYEGSPYLAEKWPNNTFTAAVPPYQNYGTVKYIVNQPWSLQSGQNAISIRYADVLLLLGEALMEQNKGADAATYVNMVRSRPMVAMPDVPSSVVADQSKLREYIHRERIRELAMEWGHVFFDLHRWGIYASEMNKYWTAGKHGWTTATQANFTATQNLWPIPQTERDLNPNLSQNPGY